MNNFNPNQPPVNRSSHPVYQNIQPPSNQVVNSQLSFNPNNVNSYQMSSFNSPYTQNSQIVDPNAIYPGFIQDQHYYYCTEDQQPQNVYPTPYTVQREASESESSSDGAPSPQISAKEVKDMGTSPILSPEPTRGRPLTKGRGRGVESNVPVHNCSCEIFKIDDQDRAAGPLINGLPQLFSLSLLADLTEKEVAIGDDEALAGPKFRSFQEDSPGHQAVLQSDVGPEGNSAGGQQDCSACRPSRSCANPPSHRSPWSSSNDRRSELLVVA